MRAGVLNASSEPKASVSPTIISMVMTPASVSAANSAVTQPDASVPKRITRT